MSTGLLALLDDIAAIAKVTAASLDDVAAQAGAAGSKAAGVVIDDAAVTPKYVVGLSPKRELPIIWNIAKGSLKNKLLFLTPAALILGMFAPWSIAPILMCGGLYLSFEGYEKIHSAAHKLLHKKQHQEKIKNPEKLKTITPEELEKQRTNSAIRTDLILSAEVIAISYAVVADNSFLERAIILVVIGIGITFCVYGAVALIVKADDVGEYMARNGQFSATKTIGNAIIKSMPTFLKVIGGIGTVAMLWVGGGIIIHNIPFLHHEMEHLTHILHLSGAIKWLFTATFSAFFGLIVGSVAAKIVSSVKNFLPEKFRKH